jgi:hypothetical protein
MPGIFTMDKNKRYQNVLKNPHLVDWYFGVRLNIFQTVFFDGVLECEWRWHRFEWQSRCTIHAHGAARLKNDPGLIMLTESVYIGRKAEIQLTDSLTTLNNLIHNGLTASSRPDSRLQVLAGKEAESTLLRLNDIIKQGKKAEEKIITYTDTLITATNTRTEAYANEIPDPHPCSIDTRTISQDDKDSDYESIINCCQRHVCRPDGYCKTKKSGQTCRFSYPIKKTATTTIEFVEKPNGGHTANIFVKRNDEYLNVHNRVAAHHWRGNVDFQIILDQHAAISYMVKYAAKGEKSSSSLNELFKTVIFHAKEDDNAQTKIKSVMMKTVSGTRDLGRGEVSRLLFSDPLYHSSFEYVVQSLDLNQSREMNNLNSTNTTIATNQTIMDFYVNRLTNALLIHTIPYNLIKFCLEFKVNKGQLQNRKRPEKTIIVTYPKGNTFINSS